MSSVKRIVGISLGLLLLVAGATLAADARTSRQELLTKSDLVFVGTVTEMGKASFAGVPVSPRSIVVRVDGIVDNPSAVSLAPGDKVTVQVIDPSAFRKGSQATFYAQGWILGAGVAVREIGHELSAQPGVAAATVTAEMRRDVDQTRKQLSDAQLSARIQAADVVVVGRVVSIQPSTMRAAPGVAPPTRITEHDPDWQEAIIEVDSAIKGAQPNDKVLAKFPASRDVAWFNVPKFTVGQQGTFLLQKDRVSGEPKGMVAGAEVQSYTALSPEDVLPTAESQRVRALMRP